MENVHPTISIEINDLYDSDSYCRGSDLDQLALVVRTDEILPTVHDLSHISSSIGFHNTGEYDFQSITDGIRRNELSYLSQYFKDGHDLSLSRLADPVLIPSMSSSYHSYSQNQLDLQQLDFIGPMEAVKQLFTLPYTTDDPILTLHRMGDVILLDSIPNKEKDSDYHIFNENLMANKARKEDDAAMSRQLQAVTMSALNQTPYPLLPSGLQSNQEKNSLLPTTTTLSQTKSEIEEFENDKYITGNAFVPPPSYYMPQPVPTAPKQVVQWNFHDVKFAVGSDTTVYKPVDRAPITLKALDISEPVEFSTCVDMYLDNVILNVPELAMALYSKGFLRGLKTINTSQIPALSSNVIFESLSDPRMAAPIFTTPHPNLHSLPQLFDPKVIDMDASAIIRFLKESCRKEDATYILRKSETGQSLHLYDLQASPLIQQRKFKWMLAMISYRFATRLCHHMPVVNSVGKIQIRLRQQSLFNTCYELLLELQQMGGMSHHTIRASVLEQMADVHLSRVDDHKLRSQRKSRDDISQSNASISKNENVQASSNVNTEAWIDSHPSMESNQLIRQSSTFDDDFEDDYDQVHECKEAIKYLSQGVTCLKEALSGEISNILRSEDTINDETQSLDSMDSDAEGSDFDINVVEEIFSQLSGVIYKLFHSSLLVAINHVRNAQIDDALNVLSEALSPSCYIWAEAKHFIDRLYHLKQSKSGYTSQKSKEDAPCKSVSFKEIASFIQLFPLLWNVFAKISREILRHTGGITYNDSHISEKIHKILLSLEALTISIIAKHDPKISHQYSHILPPNATIDEPTSPTNDKFDSKSKKRIKKKKSQQSSASQRDLCKYITEKIKRKSMILFPKRYSDPYDYSSMSNVALNTGNAPQDVFASDHSKLIHHLADAFNVIAAIVVPLLDNISITENDRIGKSNSTNEQTEFDEILSTETMMSTDDALQAWFFLDLICNETSESSDLNGKRDSFDASTIKSSLSDDIRFASINAYIAIFSVLSYSYKQQYLTTETSTDSHSGRKEAFNTKQQASNIRRPIRNPKQVDPMTKPSETIESKSLYNIHDPMMNDSLRRCGDSLNVVGQRLLVLLNTIAHKKNQIKDKRLMPEMISRMQSTRTVSVSYSLESHGVIKTSNDSNASRGQSMVMNIQRTRYRMLQEFYFLCQNHFIIAKNVLFLVDDVVNGCTVRCNISSCGRVYAMLRYQYDSIDKSSKQKTIDLLLNTASYADKTRAISLQEKFLKSISKLNDPIDRPIGNTIISELAITYLCIAILRQSQLLRDSQPLHRFFEDPYLHPFLHSAVDTISPGPGKSWNELRLDVLGRIRMDPAIERDIIDPLYTALSLFQDIRDHRMCAPCQFFLGSYCSFTISSPSLHKPHFFVDDHGNNLMKEQDREKISTSSRLELALEFYFQAHEYYVRNDVGPNLVIILLDTCDIYMDSDLSDDSEDTNASHRREILSSSLSSSLGALQSILESKLAFTTAVIKKFGAMTIGILCKEVHSRISKCVLSIMKTLKAMKEIEMQLQGSSDDSQNTSASSLTTDGNHVMAMEKNIQVFKDFYAKILQSSKSLGNIVANEARNTIEKDNLEAISSFVQVMDDLYQNPIVKTLMTQTNAS